MMRFSELMVCLAFGLTALAVAAGPIAAFLIPKLAALRLALSVVH